MIANTGTGTNFTDDTTPMLSRQGLMTIHEHLCMQSNPNSKFVKDQEETKTNIDNELAEFGVNQPFPGEIKNDGKKVVTKVGEFLHNRKINQKQSSATAGLSSRSYQSSDNKQIIQQTVRYVGQVKHEKLQTNDLKLVEKYESNGQIYKGDFRRTGLPFTNVSREYHDFKGRQHDSNNKQDFMYHPNYTLLEKRVTNVILGPNSQHKPKRRQTQSKKNPRAAVNEKQCLVSKSAGGRKHQIVSQSVTSMPQDTVCSRFIESYYNFPNAVSSSVVHTTHRKNTLVSNRAQIAPTEALTLAKQQTKKIINFDLDTKQLQESIDRKNIALRLKDRFSKNKYRSTIINPEDMKKLITSQDGIDSLETDENIPMETQQSSKKQGSNDNIQGIKRAKTMFKKPNKKQASGDSELKSPSNKEVFDLFSLKRDTLINLDKITQQISGNKKDNKNDRTQQLIDRKNRIQQMKQIKVEDFQMELAMKNSNNPLDIIRSSSVNSKMIIMDKQKSRADEWRKAAGEDPSLMRFESINKMPQIASKYKKPIDYDFKKQTERKMEFQVNNTLDKFYDIKQNPEYHQQSQVNKQRQSQSPSFINQNPRVLTQESIDNISDYKFNTNYLSDKKPIGKAICSSSVDNFKAMSGKDLLMKQVQSGICFSRQSRRFDYHEKDPIRQLSYEGRQQEIKVEELPSLDKVSYADYLPHSITRKHKQQAQK